jgi:secreted trypsin-like serine protease
MMRAWSACGALAIGIAAVPLSTPTIAGDGTNWIREQVQQRRLLTQRRALGPRTPDRGGVPQIIGGGVAPPGKWPFQVALLDAGTSNNSLAQFCGGTLITRRHVLTAAHCLEGLRASEFRVLTGTQSLGSGGTRRQVASLRIHPQYRSSTQDYDIAVATLKTVVQNVKPITMLSSTSESVFAAPGTLAYVIGWGDMQRGGGTQFPTQLRQVQVPLVTRAICNRPASYDGDVTLRMICAGYQQGGKDACQGDSGGPLIVQDGSGNWRVQAGIVSWGDECAARNFYGVYSRVAVLSNWVKAAIRSSSAVAQAGACETHEPSVRASCLDQAIASVAAETDDYLDQIKQERTPAQSRTVETAQQAWSRSLASLCAFDATTAGELGRKSCVLREMRNRAATLAAHLSAAAE